MSIDPVSSSNTQPIDAVTVNNVTFDKGLLQGYFLDAVSAYINTNVGSGTTTDAMIESGLKNGISLNDQFSSFGLLAPPPFNSQRLNQGFGPFLTVVLDAAVTSGKITQQQEDAMVAFVDPSSGGNYLDVTAAFRWPVYVQTFNG